MRINSCEIRLNIYTHTDLFKIYDRCLCVVKFPRLIRVRSGKACASISISSVIDIWVNSRRVSFVSSKKKRRFTFATFVTTNEACLPNLAQWQMFMSVGDVHRDHYSFLIVSEWRRYPSNKSRQSYSIHRVTLHSVSRRIHLRRKHRCTTKTTDGVSSSTNKSPRRDSRFPALLLSAV